MTQHAHTITDIYEENGQKWVTVQKQHTQFRAKKYKVKMSELIKIPGQQSNKETDIVQDMGGQANYNDISDEIAILNLISK